MSKAQIRILVVEDDLVDRMACRRALAQDLDDEFVLSEAETGRDGLQLAHAQKPDCILLDYHLPDMNGLEFLAELRTDPGEIPVPVMMLTGADNAAVAVESMKRGAQDYLVKDVNRQYLELLPSVIQRVLRERRTLMEKKHAEDNLLQAEAKYRFLVEQIPAIIYTTAPDAPNKLLYISPQIRQLGFLPEELLAEPEGLLKQVHPEDWTHVREAIARSYENGEPLRCEYRLLNRAGELRWFLNEASLVRHASGEALYLQGLLTDITERKRLEMKLLERRNEMNELQKMQIATQTAAAIAHELNQPLMAIASYSGAACMMLQAENPDIDEVRHALEANENQAHRASNSIRELLEFLSIKESPVEAFDLNMEIRGVIDMARSENELKFRSRLQLQMDIAPVRANSTHVQKVLLNLLHNGIEAMQEAGVSLPSATMTVRTTKKGGYAQVTIQDNGPGIRNEDFQRLFEPFFTTKGKGMGIGLAVSRSLIETNGGQLWVDPEQSPGAAFHFTLPLAT